MITKFLYSTNGRDVEKYVGAAFSLYKILDKDKVVDVALTTNGIDIHPGVVITEQAYIDSRTYNEIAVEVLDRLEKSYNKSRSK